MKCPVCDGTGKRQYIDVYGNPQDIWLECEHCKGKGYLTNDEWRKTCSAEEFAEWLKEVAHICFACSDMCAETTDEYCKYGYASEKDKWIGWLKEVHNNEN